MTLNIDAIYILFAICWETYCLIYKCTLILPHNPANWVIRDTNKLKTAHKANFSTSSFLIFTRGLNSRPAKESVQNVERAGELHPVGRGKPHECPRRAAGQNDGRRAVHLTAPTMADRPTTPELREAQKEVEAENKIVKLLTVMAYLSSVSMGAVVLSLYYIFLWDPQIPNQKRL